MEKVTPEKPGKQKIPDGEPVEKVAPEKPGKQKIPDGDPACKKELAQPDCTPFQFTAKMQLMNKDQWKIVTF